VNLKAHSEMTDTTLIIPCPACDAPNTLADGQDAKSALCSSCESALFSGQPMHLTVARFNAHVLENALPIVIDFWAEWCGPCQTMGPIFERLAAEFEPHMRFAKVDTDAEGALAQHFHIQSIPTLSVIKDRREVARIAGLLTTADLRRWLYSALSGSEDAPAAR
jgi:thioredoxin 2